MAARFNDAIKLQQGRDESAANVVKRQQSAELRKLRVDFYKMRKAYNDVVAENTALKREKEADAKTIAHMEQHSLEMSYWVEKLHQRIRRKLARYPSDSD